ncbi:hypothetical protein GSI_09892 [Ganoderma sinense ZZ0214-1]|uniref:Uncharacterized protein n=1 Tax=Ganoderma sinense ZZ0214-1 TaxID=1077348 RepID=A0A2G8S2R4_9APHY|nr:hypothetical protein GSI_09892 [Ganoderma sinense ZZ0214-1]
MECKRLIADAGVVSVLFRTATRVGAVLRRRVRAGAIGRLLEREREFEFFRLSPPGLVRWPAEREPQAASREWLVCCEGARWPSGTANRIRQLLDARSTAIIFLAPISAFDQYLEEDPRTNRIDDSLQLFTAICSNKLLSNAALTDLLRQKLESGIKVRK